jgi:hypothetical protein
VAGALQATLPRMLAALRQTTVSILHAKTWYFPQYLQGEAQLPPSRMEASGATSKLHHWLAQPLSKKGELIPLASCDSRSSMFHTRHLQGSGKWSLSPRRVVGELGYTGNERTRVTGKGVHTQTSRVILNHLMSVSCFRDKCFSLACVHVKPHPHSPACMNSPQVLRAMVVCVAPDKTGTRVNGMQVRAGDRCRSVWNLQPQSNAPTLWNQVLLRQAWCYLGNLSVDGRNDDGR